MLAYQSGGNKNSSCFIRESLDLVVYEPLAIYSINSLQNKILPFKEKVSNLPFG